MKGYLLLYEEPPDQRGIEVSIEPAVDLWLSRHRRKKILSILTPPLPLYLAFLLKSRLEISLSSLTWNEGKKEALDKETVMALFGGAPKEWRNRFDTAWKETAMPEGFPSLDPRLESWIPADAERILPLLEGRNGFMEQIERRLQPVAAELRGIAAGGMGLGRYLPLLIQYLHFHGEVELAPGISARYADGAVRIQCERCGSGRIHIHTYWCSLCETKDLICDFCYPLGASKGCSCLVRRAKPAAAERPDAGVVGEEQASYLAWSGRL